MEANQANRVNLVSCLKWVKRGVASSNPEKVKLTKDEVIEMIKDTQSKLRCQVNGPNTHSGTAIAVNEHDEYGFEQYDDADENISSRLSEITALASLPADDLEQNFIESDDSDKEDDIIKDTDNLILVGHVDDATSCLEVYVYNQVEASLYVHHDYSLSSFPLCLEWLDYEPNADRGNYCAVGSMEPIIEIWDMDIINAIQPAFKLGRKHRRGVSDAGHRDAVLSLAWNTQFEHCMASGSADHTVHLWDMECQKPTTVLRSFNEKVQCLEWHPDAGQTLLAGSCDHTVSVLDCRSTDIQYMCKLNGETEQVIWNRLKTNQFLCGSSTGTVYYFDYRHSKPMWSNDMYPGCEITGLIISDQCPGLIAVGSSVGPVTLWEMRGDHADFVCEYQPNIGDGIQCMGVCPDTPFAFAFGGSKKDDHFRVFDIQNLDDVRHRFGLTTAAE